MGLEQVKNEILQEAKEKADEIESEGKEEKKEILAEAEETIEEIEEEHEEKLEEEKEELEKQILSKARMNAKKSKLETKQKETEKVFEDFEREITEMVKEDSSTFVENCLEKADFNVETVRGSEVFSNEATQRGFEFEEIDSEGLELVSEDGSRSISFKIDDIVKEFKNRYRKEVSNKIT